MDKPELQSGSIKPAKSPPLFKTSKAMETWGANQRESVPMEHQVEMYIAAFKAIEEVEGNIGWTQQHLSVETETKPETDPHSGSSVRTKLMYTEKEGVAPVEVFWSSKYSQVSWGSEERHEGSAAGHALPEFVLMERAFFDAVVGPRLQREQAPQRPSLAKDEKKMDVGALLREIRGGPPKLEMSYI